MKLATILYKYLAANKKLSLSGLGSFYAENNYDPDAEPGKRGIAPIHISFEQHKVEQADEALIDFIAKETGKMRVLAASDLSSQLDDMLQFLNTGKPYSIAGFGTLTKKQDGNYDFFPEKITNFEKKKEFSKTEKNHLPQTYIDNTKTRAKNFKPAIIIMALSLIAIAATVWFYVKNSEENKKGVEDITEQHHTVTAKPLADTSAKKDTTKVVIPTTPAQGLYTYVLETAKQARATKRFNQLKRINWPVELETTDSVNYSIIMKLPAAGSDTARVKDSLRVLSGRQVYIK